MWEVKVGMYFSGGFGGPYGSIFEQNNHLIQTRILCKICDFPFIGQILNFKKSIFFRRYGNRHEMRSCNEVLFQKA